MKVLWTDTALGHLTAIHGYVAQDAPLYGRLLIDRLTFRSRQIAQFPQSGRIVPEYEADAVREVIEGAYRIIYEVNPDNISVLAVIHGAQLLPPRPGP